MAEQWGFKQDCALLIMMLQNNRDLSIVDACAEVDRLGFFPDAEASPT
jgi:hypothetical protein